MSKATNPKEASKQVQGKAQQVVRTASEPAPVRRYRRQLFLLALVIVILAFATLSFLVYTIPSFQVDIQITKTIQLITNPLFEGLMVTISWFGFPPQSVIFTIAVILIIYLSGLRWEAVTAAVAALSSTIVTLLIKNLIQRVRPSADLVTVIATLTDFSFPSGHVMFYLCFLGFTWFLILTMLKSSVTRTILLVLVGFLVLTVGISRIYLGQHWASDVLGAYLLGTVMLAGIIEFYQWGKKRYFTHQPVAPENKAD